ncbi:MAG: S-layer homology domain-containing protein [Clostridia bacterium]|nr:S-layer homology domain-containing protein [Clostridia bacterium]
MNAKRILAFVLSCIMLLGTCVMGIGAAEEKLPFTDVPENEWFYGAVEYVYANGLMNGTGNGSVFSPKMNLTRGMVVTVLYRNDSSPAGKYPNVFADVAEGTYYATAAAWAYKNAVVTGTGFDEWGDPLFSPDRNITRQELAAMFARYAAYRHVDTTKNTAELDSFPDSGKVASWAEKEFKWSSGTGIITGKANGGVTTLAPEDLATRAEFATMIQRYNVKDDAREFSYLHAYETPVLKSQYTEKEYLPVTDADVYVSVDGSDKNDGSFEKPLATFEAAVEKVREIKATKKTGGIVVAFMAGEYEAPVDLVLTSADAGTAECPISYVKYGDGEVIFNAGMSFSSEDFTALTDAEREMFPAEAQNKIKKIDLGKYGLDASKLTEDNAVFAGEERMDLARWPNKTIKGNDDFVDKHYVASVNIEDKSLVLRDSVADRLNKYHNIDDMYMLGYYKYDWSYSQGKIIAYDAETGTIKPTINGYGLGTSSEFNLPCFYFYNIPDELDRADEYYIDRKTGTLYVMDPKGTYTLAKTGQMMTMTDTDYVSFVGLEFCYGTGTFMSATESDHVTFDRLYVHNMRSKGISITGDKVTVTSSEFYDVGARNVELVSGDRNTLTKGNSEIVNCLFDKFGSVEKTGQSAIYVWGCGIRIAHNEICNSSNMGIYYSEYIQASNYITIEYNYIHNVVTQTNDSGAIYGGRNLAGHGSVVRYNLISNIGDADEGYNPIAIYLDDYMSGQEVYGNIIFSSAGGNSIFMHGGRENKIHDNIFITLKGSAWQSDVRLNSEDHEIMADRTEDFTKPIGDHEHLMILELVPFRSEIWAQHFPTLAKCKYDKQEPMASIKDDIDFIINSSYNEVYDNHSFTSDVGLKSEYLTEFSDNVRKHATRIEENKKYTLEENPYFVDPTHGDYTVKDGAGILDIQYEKIGRY